MAASAFGGQTIPERYDTITDTMPVTALHHVQLAMPRGREDEARRFYLARFGVIEELKKMKAAGAENVPTPEVVVTTLPD